jgi:protein SCO1/2
MRTIATAGLVGRKVRRILNFANRGIKNSSRRLLQSWGFLWFIILTVVCAWSGHAARLLDSDLNQIRFDQNLGAQVSPELDFVDEQGRAVRLADYLGKKPVVLNLGYYECPMLCTLVLNGMVECLGDMRWTIGKEYTLVSVSIDPRETPALAAAKKKTYLKRYGRPEAETGWHFLTGNTNSIQTLAREIGFHYAYDPEVKQFAHPSGFVVLTPDGKIARYFFGVTFSPREVYAALNAASTKTIGSRIQDLVLLCFHYRPLTGRFGASVMLILRLGAVATVAAILALIVNMARREKSVNSGVAVETNART